MESVCQWDDRVKNDHSEDQEGGGRENNIKMDFKEVGCENVIWLEMI
jgi:hypothetical protein